MTTNSNVAIREYLQEKKLITDGSFGTYYGDKYETQQMPELCNFDQVKYGESCKTVCHCDGFTYCRASNSVFCP